MNMLNLLLPNSECGAKMKKDKPKVTEIPMAGESFTGKGMLEEFHLEMNPGNAHIDIRTNELAMAKELAKRLYPASYVREGPTGIWYIHLAESETDNNNAIGCITRHEVPQKWVISRRIEDVQKVA